MSLPASTVTVERADASCTVVCGDSREELKAYRGQVDLVVTSPLTPTRAAPDLRRVSSR